MFNGNFYDACAATLAWYGVKPFQSKGGMYCLRDQIVYEAGQAYPDRIDHARERIAWVLGDYGINPHLKDDNGDTILESMMWGVHNFFAFLDQGGLDEDAIDTFIDPRIYHALDQGLKEAHLGKTKPLDINGEEFGHLPLGKLTMSEKTMDGSGEENVFVIKRESDDSVVAEIIEKQDFATGEIIDFYNYGYEVWESKIKEGMDARRQR